ncbi:MAG: UDP-N-acetylglucosamine--N-acetylmuramyl-(pentapeptide) pyrophosphoryl-undecaprenol N-acetylglucosamine transferase [Candidatus Saccharimonadales bacterium]
MRILLSGGGTGGHITPILAVAHELKQLSPDNHTMYVGERHGAFASLVDTDVIDEVHNVYAGKFRRYYGESNIRRIFDIKTNLKNLRDLGYFCIGTAQSYRLLKKLRPDVVFLKGGFVGVPVGIAAGLLHIPIVTHDSDAIPGLANRIVSRWVSKHAVANNPSEYSYPTDKVAQVGVLVEPNYNLVKGDDQNRFKKQLNLPQDKPLLLVTGGSSGAVRINEVIVSIVAKLLSDEPDLWIVHQVGQGKGNVYGDFKHDRLRVEEFLRPMYVYTGAADLVVARSSANTIAELSTQAKAVIVVPSPFLAAGHQLKNAERLEEQGAAIVLQETMLYDVQHGMLTQVEYLLSHEDERVELASRLHEQATENAASKLAVILIDFANHKEHHVQKT